MSLSNNIEFLNRLRKMNGINGLDPSLWGGKAPGAGSRLVETASFGPNPGDLRMFSFVPAGLLQKMPLVVVLHGCGQSAAGYEIGAGWSTLAQRYGFALLMPEQKSSNNPNGCFNWFVPEDTRRGGGEAASIRQMIEQIAGAKNIDRQRIFVTGLSAGGAMTAVMLATYPEVFAAGAIIAGLPYGIANNVQQALNGMMQSPPRSARELGDLVRKASPHRGPWPKLSVWHGSADRTVHPSNADEIVKQWLDLHQLPETPMALGKVDGYPRQIWWNADGETVVESYTITRMPHGTPLGVAANDERYGVEGAFLIEAGISSSYHIANFFGLTGRIHQPSPGRSASTAIAMPDLTAPRLEQVEEVAQAYKARGKGDRRAEPRDQPGRRGIDVNAVITRALTAAGLMK
ncbi:MAG: PHB depolymerase family esterase [Rhodopseudomonas sp.]|uniref:extracellular catalytic domain type 1 short-chain-length polyhydroxyalkanoate depolymerase n=1 Tax=Rhodopseudomonas sp. TaxID=1078 RepID=UPI0017E8E104|nr:PHB depolymerase family esterase [Rhodopseudomonas sp.]NVN85605.1 PHB depolymerase family esterase [Rhodopseudomonas sp.]